MTLDKFCQVSQPLCYLLSHPWLYVALIFSMCSVMLTLGASAGFHSGNYGVDNALAKRQSILVAIQECGKAAIKAFGAAIPIFVFTHIVFGWPATQILKVSSEGFEVKDLRLPLDVSATGFLILFGVILGWMALGHWIEINYHRLFDGESERKREAWERKTQVKNEEFLRDFQRRRTGASRSFPPSLSRDGSQRSES